MTIKGILDKLKRKKREPQPELETAKFSRGEKKVYNEVLAMHAALMLEIRNLDSGDMAIHAFALFLQDLDAMSISRREYGYVIQSCYIQYCKGLIGLIVEHWDVREKEVEKESKREANK